MTEIALMSMSVSFIVPYPSYPYPRLQPARLSAIARLFGLPTQPAATARTLEIGCAEGGHIIPLAAAAPHAHFVGIDSILARFRDSPSFDPARTMDVSGLLALSIGAPQQLWIGSLDADHCLGNCAAS